MKLNDIIVNEEIIAIPDSNSKLVLLKNIMKRPLVAKHAKQALHNVLSNSDLNTLLTSLETEDPSQDIRPAMSEYLSTAYPEISEFISDSNTGIRDNNIEGTLSVVGHKDEIKH